MIALILTILRTLLLIAWRILPALEGIIAVLDRLGWLKKHTSAAKKAIETEKLTRAPWTERIRRRKK